MSFNNTKRKVHFPEYMSDYNVEKLYFPPYAPELGLIFLSLNDKNNYILTGFQLLYDENLNAFVPVQCLFDLKFENYNLLKRFLDKLPDLSALEMLIFLNSKENDITSYMN